MAHEATSIPIEIQQQDGGTLLVVSLFSWRLSVTAANKKLVELIARQLCRNTRPDKGFVDVEWQYAQEEQRDVVFSLDDYLHADTPDWLERLTASVRRLEQFFLALDPLVQAAAGGDVHEGSARVVVRDFAERLSGRRRSPEVARLREAFPAVTMERFDGDILRAIQLEGAPEAIIQTLHALDAPPLRDVEEVCLSFEADAVARWLDGGRLARRLPTVVLTDLDAGSPALVCALLEPFKDCTHLSLQLDDEERFNGVRAVASSAPAFEHLEVLEIDCDASEAVEETLLDLLFTWPMPKLRRFALNSRKQRRGADSLGRILARLPEHVTELGLWQRRPEWTDLREALLSSSVLDRLRAVGVLDDVDEMSDPRLVGKALFGPGFDAVNVAHDLGEVGRHRDVVDQLGPLHWRSRDADLHALYAGSLCELDPAAGVDAWRAVLALEPANAMALHNLANVLMAGGRLEEAFPVVVDALAANPDEPWMLRCLAAIWQRRGDAAEAAVWARRFAVAAAAAVDDDEDGAALYVLACAQMWSNERARAFASLERAVAVGLVGVTPDVDVEWDPVRDDARWQRLLGADAAA